MGNLTWNPNEVPNSLVADPADYQFEFKEYEITETGENSKIPGTLMIMVKFEGANLPQNGNVAGMQLRKWFVLGSDANPKAVDEKALGTINLKKTIEACNVPLRADLGACLNDCVGAQLVFSVGQKDDDREPGAKQNFLGKPFPLSANRVLGVAGGKPVNAPKPAQAQTQTPKQAPAANATPSASPLQMLTFADGTTGPMTPENMTRWMAEQNAKMGA